MAKADKEEMARINPFYETMVGKAFNIDYGPMRVSGMTYCRVLKMEQGWLYVRPVEADGKPDGDPLWVSPSYFSKLYPINGDKYAGK